MARLSGKTSRPGARPGLRRSSKPFVREAQTEGINGILDENGFFVPFNAQPGVYEFSLRAELRRIPIGQTHSYGEIARVVGAPESARAVARANGMNRVAIVIPCHRVIGADGALTGYAGGLDRKERLLRLEGALPRPAAPPRSVPVVPAAAFARSA